MQCVCPLSSPFSPQLFQQRGQSLALFLVKWLSDEPVGELYLRRLQPRSSALLSSVTMKTKA